MLVVAQVQVRQFSQLLVTNAAVLDCTLQLFRREQGEAAAPVMLDLFAAEGTLPVLFTTMAERETAQHGTFPRPSSGFMPCPGTLRDFNCILADGLLQNTSLP
jgi:hypothetical protein